MDDKLAIIAAITTYKVISLLVGLLFGFMGYKLFIAGVFGRAGNMDVSVGDNKILLKKAAPGTFFALFGAIIISLTIYQGLDFKDQKQMTKPPLPSLKELKDDQENN